MPYVPLGIKGQRKQKTAKSPVITLLLKMFTNATKHACKSIAAIRKVLTKLPTAIGEASFFNLSDVVNAHNKILYQCVYVFNTQLTATIMLRTMLSSNLFAAHMLVLPTYFYTDSLVGRCARPNDGKYCLHFCTINIQDRYVNRASSLTAQFSISNNLEFAEIAQF